jgi:adenylosuccinate lyase
MCDAMTHGIFTSTGNLVAWFESEQAALAVLAELARDEPEAADEIAAVPFDDDGKACGPAIRGSALLAKAPA